MTRRILLDCDPGNDDALGILVGVGHPGLDLRAVTTGAGHLAGSRTARNAAIAMKVAGRHDIPVAAGAIGPLVRERLIAKVLDLDSALDSERAELDAVSLDPRQAVELMIATANEAPTTFVTTGPLTNLALALRLDPGLAAKIERIVMLGGAWGLGNKTAAAEWNIFCDPEAAAIVFTAGIPITMIPIDASAQVVISAQLIADVDALGTPAGAFAVELLRSLVKTFKPGLLGPAEMPLNDPIAVLVAAQPGLARTVPARVEVELAGQHTYGRTVIDFAGRSALAANADVAITLDATGLHSAFVSSLTRLTNPVDR